MVKQINLLPIPRHNGRLIGRQVGRWLLVPLLFGIALPLGVWRWQQAALESVVADQRELDARLQVERRRLAERHAAAHLLAQEPEALRKREQRLATLRSRSAALGRRQGYSAQFELLADTISDGAWLTSVEMGRSDSGIIVNGLATDTTRAMQQVQQLISRLNAAGCKVQGYEIHNSADGAQTAGGSSFRVF